MKAIKRVLAVRNGKIVLNLPDDFQTDRVEVIVLSYETGAEPSGDLVGDWQKDFLSVSEWDEDKTVPRVLPRSQAPAWERTCREAPASR